MSEPRTLFIDPDFRRTPKTKVFCCVCQRDLRPKAARRFVFLQSDGWHTIEHPQDQHSENVVRHAVGLDCARKLGLEWSVAA